VSVDLLNRQRKVHLDARILAPLMEAAMNAAGVADRDVTVVLVSDRAIHRMNKQWRGMDSPTDCLSFPTAEGEGSEFAGPELGDIVISLERALEQGPIHLEGDVPPEKALESEVLFLFVHSLLHLMGYDHQKPGDTRRMKAMEKRILAAL
jgi:probable rRNA maturation factor